jgi:hypothetical protein
VENGAVRTRNRADTVAAEIRHLGKRVIADAIDMSFATFSPTRTPMS